jgi:hypothetical protein
MEENKTILYLKHEAGTGERGSVVVQVEHLHPEHANCLFGWMSVVCRRHRESVHWFFLVIQRNFGSYDTRYAVDEKLTVSIGIAAYKT